MRQTTGCRRVAAGLMVVALGVLAPRAHAQSGGSEALLERRANLDIEGVSMREALGALQARSGVPIGFSAESLPRDRKVSCKCADKTVREALLVLLDGTDLRFVARSSQILVTRIPHSDNGGPTTQSVGGFVRVADTDEPVGTARVELRELRRATLTDRDGRFVIASVPPGTYTVDVDALGFVASGSVSAVVSLDGPTILLLELERRPLELAEIIVSPGTFGMMGDEATIFQQTLTRDEMEVLPQFGEDVFRVMERIPGVATDDISAKMSVRGGNADELLIMLDGTELFEPYHLKDLDAALGIVDMAALSGVSLVTGGLTPEYGDRLTGLFDMRTQQPFSGETRSSVGLSISNLTARTQGTFADGRGGWLFSARRGFLDIVLAIAGDDATDDDLSPRYFDVLGKVQYLISDSHMLSAHILYAGDDLELKNDNGPEDNGLLNTNWTNAYGWLKWDWAVAEWLSASTVLSAAGLERTREGSVVQLGSSEEADVADVIDRAHFDFVTARQDWRVSLSERVLLKLGGQVRRGASDYDYDNTTGQQFKQADGSIGLAFDSLSIALGRNTTESGAYLATRVRPLDALTIELGGRYDYRSHTADSDVSPRVQAALDLTDNTTLRASWGRYFQSHGVDELSVVDGDTTFFPSESAEQVAVGVQHKIGIRGEVRVEAYTRNTRDPRPRYLNLGRQIIPFPEIGLDRVRFAPERGRAKGLEFFFAGPLGRRADWSLTYVLSKAQDFADGRWVPRTLDQRHTVNARWHFQPSAEWELSAGWQYHTGWPATPMGIQVDTVSASGESLRLILTEIPGEINSLRLPSYQRMDVRATRTFQVGRGRLRVFLDVFNLFDRVNLRSYEYDLSLNNGRASVIQSTGETLFPILPSFGLTWEF